jgi:hypothetical protein
MTLEVVMTVPASLSSFVRITGLAALLSASACVGADDASSEAEAVEADESAVVGDPSDLKAVVVVVDANDRYLCTGVAISETIVHAAIPCGPNAAAVYVGFSKAIARSTRLGPVAGSARKIAVASTVTLPGFAGRRLHLASPTSFVRFIDTQLPAAGNTCVVVGYGPTSTSIGAAQTVGEQRSAIMLVTETWSGELHAVGYGGTVLNGDLDAFLMCGGRTVGPKMGTAVTPNGSVETIFSTLGQHPAPQCTPGNLSTTLAGCADGQRFRRCQPNGRWGSWSATCL